MKPGRGATASRPGCKSEMRWVGSGPRHDIVAWVRLSASLNPNGRLMSCAASISS